VTDSAITAAAKVLKARHAALLAAEPRLASATGRLPAEDALDAARERLRGGSRQVADQLSLDVRG
jgi:hypothetical protein